MVAGTMMMSSTAGGGRHQAAPNSRICTGLVKRKEAEVVKVAVPAAAAAFKSKQEEKQDHPGSKKQQQQHLECSMCGDVGFATELFKCKKCLRRYQHTYCSRFYPHTLDQDTCEWCCLSGDRSSNNPSNCSTGSSNNNTHMFNHSTSVIPCKGPPPTSQLKAGANQQLQLSGKRKQQQPQPDARNGSSINGLSRAQKQYADALELLLEVAQTASEVGKGTKPMAKKQRTEQVVEDSSTSSTGVAAVRQQQQQQQQQRGNAKRMVSSASKLHFSSNSRIRYKLLSDVLC